MSSNVVQDEVQSIARDGSERTVAENELAESKASASDGVDTPNADASGGVDTPNADASGGVDTPNADASDGVDTPNADASDGATAPGSAEISGSRGLLGDAVEWVWRGAAIKQARERAQRTPPAARVSAKNAHLCAELAERARKPIEPFKHGVPDAQILELYRQTVHWALLALAQRSGLLHERTETAVDEHPERDTATRSDSERSDPKRSDSERSDPKRSAGVSLHSGIHGLSTSQLLERALEAQLLPALASDPSKWEPLEQISHAQDFIALADLSETQGDLTRQLSMVVRELLLEVDAPFAVGALWRQRWSRGAAALIALGVCVAVGLGARDEYRMSHELSAGKPWKTSSSNGLGCRSPAKECKGSKNFFFHTKYEVDPWFSIDLGTPTRFSAVHIENRVDCCYHRALPLIVEVRNGTGEWHEVARQTEMFQKVWRANFDEVEATEVRLRVPRWSYLHLKDVRVLR